MNFTKNISSSHDLNLESFFSKKALENFFEVDSRIRIFDPLTTLYCSLHQAINQCSLKTALISLNIKRIAEKQKTLSLNTSALTKAKQRLCATKIFNLLLESGEKVSNLSNQFKWRGREVLLGDGTIINLEDTDDIKNKYPLSYSKGIQQGQPKLRLMGLFCGASGAFIDGEVGSYKGKGTAETTLLVKLLQRVKPNTVLVLDRFFTSLHLQCLMHKKEIDYVIRARDHFATKHLDGKRDKVITLKVSKATQDEIIYKDHSTSTQEITLRLIKSSIKRDGFREAYIYIITSFIDKNKYSKKEIEKLYLSRWGVELDFRNIKTTMRGTTLRSKTAEGSIKELWILLLGYNLIRSFTVESAKKSITGRPRKISFKAAMKFYIVYINQSKDIESILNLLSKVVLNSKYRREARAIKKRNYRYKLLNCSREEAKNKSFGYSSRRGPKGHLEDMAA